jgi:hypothetical protein
MVIIIFICANTYSQKNNDPGNKIQNVYRASVGKNGNKNVWIIDGFVIRRDLFGEFLYGGNHQRYPWIPKDEIWIDNAISAEEFKYTLIHEINERDLMANRSMDYSEAHDSSSAVERRIRMLDMQDARIHELKVGKVQPIDCDGIKEIASLPDSINLRGVYRQLVTKSAGLSIWIVDGANIRRDIFPDFGLSGNDLAYKFIPKYEIWIDGQISCEETRFSIIAETAERDAMARGKNYDDAYTIALKTSLKYRLIEKDNAKNQKPINVPKILVNETGTKDEK